MKILCSSETSVKVYWTTLRHMATTVETSSVRKLFVPEGYFSMLSFVFQKYESRLMGSHCRLRVCVSAYIYPLTTVNSRIDIYGTCYVCDVT
jgi:hypothetical protein